MKEYYKNKSIISWSHNGAHEFRFWERMGLLLGKDYVTQILANSQFGLNRVPAKVGDKKFVMSHK